MAERLNKTVPPKLLPERYMLDPYVMFIEHRNFMFEIFDKAIEQHLQAGFFSYCFATDDNVEYFKKRQKHEVPFKVLTLDELEAGFVVSTSPLVLSFAVFCFEWFVTLKDLVVFLFIFKTYFKIIQSEHVHVHL